MEWNENNLDEIVKFINGQLAKNISMTKIENEVFGVNRRVISKRLINRGYAKINNRFVTKAELEELTRIDDEQIEQNKLISKNNHKNTMNELQIDFIKKDLDILKKSFDDINELLELKDSLKELIQEYNKSKSIVEVQEPIELKIDTSLFEGGLTNRLIKVHDNVNTAWIEFCKQHNQFKMQDLYSIALLEFIQRYKK